MYVYIYIHIHIHIHIYIYIYIHILYIYIHILYIYTYIIYIYILYIYILYIYIYIYYIYIYILYIYIYIQTDIYIYIYILYIKISVYMFSFGLPSDLPFFTWRKKCCPDMPRLPPSLRPVGGAECDTICVRWKVDKVWMSKFIAHEIEVALQPRLKCESFR